jgi:carboxypeptidase family protein
MTVRMMNLTALAGALIIATGALAGSQSRETDRLTGTAILAGRVVRDSAPVARAVVAINAGDGRSARQTVTTDDGRFVFENLPPGRFLVTASKTGWVTSHYGSMRPGRPPGVRVALENGARVNIEIPMVPGSVLAGRIVDEAGRPMSRQFPWLLEYRMVGDRRMLARARLPLAIGFFERSTDDRGEFRLFGLPPGTYYLFVTPTITSGARVTTADEVRWAMQPPGDARGPAPAPGPVAGYASFYFPGTPDPSAAQPIVVGPAEVREGLTFRVGFVSVARVAGVVRRPDGSPAAGASIVLEARDANVSLEGSGRQVRSDPEGRFVFNNVPPGDYRIAARAATATSTTPQPAVLDLWGQAEVIVAGRDIDGMALALAPASAISGRVTFDGAALTPPADLTRIRLQFVATAALAAAITGAGSGSALHTAAVQADGTFRVEGLPPDRYIAAASWPGMRTGDGTTGWWLTSIRVGARDLADTPIPVPANADVRDVTLTFRDRIGAIEGSLTDAAGRPAPEYFVLAFPVERTSWTTTSRRVVTPVHPGTDGRFRITGLLAGEYYLAVVTTIDSDDATDPAFLEAILPGAIRIAVAEGETRRQDLRIGR